MPVAVREGLNLICRIVTSRDKALHSLLYTYNEESGTCDISAMRDLDPRPHIDRPEIDTEQGGPISPNLACRHP